MQERVAKLAGGVAVIKVGAGTEIEMKEKKARVEDALHSTRAANEEGVVPGGGVALVRALQAVDSLEGDNEDQNVGIALLLKAVTPLCVRSSRMRAKKDPLCSIRSRLAKETLALTRQLASMATCWRWEFLIRLK